MTSLVFFTAAVGYAVTITLYAFPFAVYRQVSSFDYYGDNLFIWFDRGVIVSWIVAVSYGAVYLLYLR